MPSRLTSCLSVVVVLLTITTSAAPAAQSRRSTPAPNSGMPGSRCAAVGVDAPRPAGAKSLDTTGLGPSARAVRDRRTRPTPADRGQPAKRVMMMLHGGGWYTVGQGALDITQGNADLWRDVGWESVNVDYLPCRRAFTSALAMYDLVRAHYPESVPVCISGDSAGAQLALLIAAKRRTVACVIANSPPTDLVRIRRQGLNAATAGVAPSLLRTGAEATGGVALAAFGRLGIRPASPIRSAAKIHTRVLLATARDDILIPVAQIAAMERALRKANPGGHVVADVLEPGSQRFVHGTASPDEVADYYRSVGELVAPFGNAPDSIEQSTAKPVGNFVDKLLGKLLPGIFRKRG